MRRIVLLAAICGIALASLHAQPAAPSRPNIVLIITDDVGYGDIGSYGAPDIKTPNIDSLARTGTRFTQFYANGSSCTPTRAGLISGRYQQRFAMERPLSARHQPRRPRWGCRRPADRCRSCCATSGYATGLIGKWHLGYLPQIQPEGARLRFVLRFQERLHRLLPAHRRLRQAGSVRGRQADQRRPAT